MSVKFIIRLICFSLVFIPTFVEGVDLRKELDTKAAENSPAEVQPYKDEYGATITEYKTTGKTWMIKIQPAGDFPAYYLYDDDGNGSFERRVAGTKQPSPPMWIIKRF